MEQLRDAGDDEVEAFREKRRAAAARYRQKNREKLALKQRLRRKALKGE